MSLSCLVNDLIPDSPISGAKRRLITGDKLMFSKVEIDKGIKVPVHRHSHEQFTYVLKGKLEITWGEDKKTEILGPDSMVFYSEDIPHESKALEDTVVLEAFAPIVEDYLRFAKIANE